MPASKFASYNRHFPRRNLKSRLPQITKQAMTLCDLCKTIPLDGLPAFPDEDIARSLSGLTYFHQFFLRTRELESVGFKHHSDLQSLRAAAAAGCGLCRLIESQADCILADIDGLGEERRGPFECQPQFDLWLTTLPNGRAGFLVLTNGKWERKSAVCPMAAIGFCAEEGASMCLML